MAQIAITNVYKRFGPKPVLRGVELSVDAGQTVALLGSNGAGKTTLMRLIAGLSRPDRGEITLGGVRQTRQLHELRRYIGLVSHLPLLYDHLTGWENLRFFAQLYDLQTPETRIEAVLQSVELWRRRHDPVRTYSRGMVQRLAIARAILHDPPVLLLDEPDTGLDPSSAELLHQLIQRASAGSRSILLTTHNLEHALTWSDTICLLSHGVITGTHPTQSLDNSALRQLYNEANLQ